MAGQPENPFHPGEILLEEFLQPAGITQTAMAARLGWTTTRLNELIKGKRGITANRRAGSRRCIGNITESMDEPPGDLRSG